MAVTLAPLILLIGAAASMIGLFLQDVIHSVRLSGVLIILASVPALISALSVKLQISRTLRWQAAIVLLMAFVAGVILVAFPIPAACALGLLKESCA